MRAIASYDDTNSVYRRNLVLREKSSMRLEQMKQKKLETELKECTFKPDTTATKNKVRKTQTIWALPTTS